MCERRRKGTEIDGGGWLAEGNSRGVGGGRREGLQSFALVYCEELHICLCKY